MPVANAITVHVVRAEDRLLNLGLRTRRQREGALDVHRWRPVWVADAVGDQLRGLPIDGVLVRLLDLVVELQEARARQAPEVHRILDAVRHEYIQRNDGRFVDEEDARNAAGAGLLLAHAVLKKGVTFPERWMIIVPRTSSFVAMSIFTSET